MVETKDIFTGGIGVMAFIALVLSFPQIGDSDLEPTHACVEEQITAFCDRLSGSGRTCYPEPNTRAGSNLCDGVWREIPDAPVVSEPVRVERSSVKVTCDANGCA